MHEMGLAAGLVPVIQANAGGRQVERVVIEIGAFAGVNHDAFAFCADSIFQTDINPDIDIVLNDVPGEALCSCGTQYHTTDMLEPCPGCGGFDRRIIGGKELILKSIEVTDD